MYKSPDFIKVNVNVNDVFASYGGQSCPVDEYGGWQYTTPCVGTPNYQYVTNTFITLGLGHQCYSTLNP